MKKRPAIIVILVPAITVAGSSSALAASASSSRVEELSSMLRAYVSAPNLNDVEKKLKEHPTEASEALISVLDSGDSQVKARAASILQRLSHNPDFCLSNASTKTLVGMLKSTEDRQVKSCLIVVMGNVGPRDPSIQDSLIGIISADKDATLRRSAVDALGKVSRAERPALHAASTAALLAALKHDDSPAVRAAAAIAITACNIHSPAILEALTNALNDDVTVRTAAMQSLAQYGPGAKSTVPKILEILKSTTDQHTQRTCINTLTRLDSGSPEVVLTLLSFGDNQLMMHQVIRYLRTIGPQAAPAVPKLIEMLKSPERNTKVNAMRALEAIGPAAKDAIPALTEALHDENGNVIIYAQQALRRIQPEVPQ